MKFSFLLLFSQVLGKADEFDYKVNGANWPSLPIPKNNCDGGILKNQSPIDLLNSWEQISAKEDNFQKIYTNQVGNIEVAWNGHTS